MSRTRTAGLAVLALLGLLDLAGLAGFAVDDARPHGFCSLAAASD